MKKLLAIACLLSVLTLSVFGQLRILQERTFRPQLQHSLYLTNAQKLSLPANTPVGTEVMVSDWVVAGLAGPHQRLKASSAAVAGVYVYVDTLSYADSAGLYTVRGTANGRNYYNLVGQASDAENLSIYYNAGWQILNSEGGVVILQSDQDVATPDLVTTWTDPDLNPANISVTSFTEGELAAGVTANGGGVSSVDGQQYVDGSYTRRTVLFQGRYFYTKVGAASNANQNSFWNRNVTAEPYWAVSDFEDQAAYLAVAAEGHAFADAAFPWRLTWVANDSLPPAPTVTRNDVASEANWEVVP